MLRVIALAVGLLLATASRSVAVDAARAPTREPPTSTPLEDLRDEALIRRPIGVALLGSRLWVANERVGSLTAVSTRGRSVERETRVATRLSALARVDDQLLLATDPDAHETILVDCSDARPRVIARFGVAQDPVALAVHAASGRFAVSSRWSRRVTSGRIVDTRHDGSALRVESVIDLPFAPRDAVFVEDGALLVVAAAFGGRIAVIDIADRRVVSLRRIHAHNSRGLTLADDGQSVLIAQQMLTSHLPTTRERVFWGSLLSNVLRSIPLDELLPRRSAAAPTERLIAHWRLEPLGRNGSATGDPSATVALPGGGRVVALTGVDEIGISRSSASALVRVRVGRGPIAIAASSDGAHAWVANRFDDTVSLVDLRAAELITSLDLGPDGEPTDADRGEALFHDARLSLDGWFSCHSCHTDGHSNGLLNDNFGDDSEGTPKRVPSLLGVGASAPWAWNGSRDSLHDQVRKSIRLTMREESGRADRDEETSALVSYLLTLDPPPSVERARETLDPNAVRRGAVVFEEVGCVRCHDPRSAFTTPRTWDVGLEDEKGARRFNPPSLRGVGQRDRLLHDASADGIEEAIHRHAEAPEAEDLAALIAFLRSL